jgi:hypothetical protein
MAFVPRRSMRVLLCVSLAFAACRAPAPSPSSPADVPAAERFTVLPASQAARVLRSCSPVPGGDALSARLAWVPDTPLVRQVEVRLPMLLDSVLPIMARANGLEHVATRDRYYRQYIGFELEGRHLVYVHGFHETLLRAFATGERDIIPWRSDLMDVCDAGAAVFGVFYDPGTGAFGRLEFSDSFNGAVRY